MRFQVIARSYIESPEKTPKQQAPQLLTRNAGENRERDPCVTEQVPVLGSAEAQGEVGAVGA